MPSEVDALVIGAGIIGVAIARALALAGREVILVEQERSPGQHTSSRNSEVLHAGLYYPPGSLKARLCVAGRPALVDYCRAQSVPHAQPGKLIVATHRHQHSRLDHIEQRARQNGVDSLLRLDAAAVRAREPTIEATEALWSPDTGIVDSHTLLRALLADAQRHGAMLSPATTVLAIDQRPGGLTVVTEPLRLRCRLVVNAAGHGAHAIARRTQGLVAQHIPPQHWLKGTYFRLAGPSPWRHLIYPVPDTASLGIHVTLDLAGQARFGPDQQWVDHLDYALEPDRAAHFERAIRAYYPDLDPARLQPDYVGVRPKVVGPGQPAADFIIDGPATHGIDGLCNLFGIESPGLTACLAIADHVVRTLR